MADSFAQDVPLPATELPATNGGGDVDMADSTPALTTEVKQEPQTNDIASTSFALADAAAAVPYEHNVQPPGVAASAGMTASAPLPSLAAARTSTPGGTRASTPSLGANATASTTALPPSAIIPPANPHGSPTRVYLNQRVTPSLLEGMKHLAAQEPERPLQWLGEFLLRKSKELENA